MARQNNELTIEQKLEIRTLYRKKKELGITSNDIANKFGKSRQTISSVINDKSLIPLENKTLVREEKMLASKMIDYLETIQSKVLKRIDEQLDNGSGNLTSLVKALKEVGNELRLINGKPTEIKETRKLSVDLNKLQELSPDKIADYLAGGSVKAIEVDYEVQEDTKTENDNKVEVEASN